jgi:hypothetical protein
MVKKRKEQWALQKSASNSAWQEMCGEQHTVGWRGWIKLMHCKLNGTWVGQKSVITDSRHSPLPYNTPEADEQGDWLYWSLITLSPRWLYLNWSSLLVATNRSGLFGLWDVDLLEALHTLAGILLSSGWGRMLSCSCCQVSLYVTHIKQLEAVQGYIQKFLHWVDNEIYAYNNKHLLRSNTKGYGGKTHLTNSQNIDTTACSGR